MTIIFLINILGFECTENFSYIVSSYCEASDIYIEKVPVLIIVNLTTTLIVALLAATSLSTIAYAAEQQALAWGGGFGGCGFGFGCGGFIVQKINQENICTKAICINQAENRANEFGFGP